MEPGYLDIAAAARWSCVSSRTIERWIVRGLPVYRGSSRGKRLLKVADLEVFMVRQAARVDLGQLVDEIAAPLLASRKLKMPHVSSRNQTISR